MKVGSVRRRTLIALAFLLPNLLGFLIFTAGPIVFSLYMSLTDWSLTKHNQFSDQPLQFVGFDNYAKILWGSESEFFWDYFENTLFLMIGIPISIAGSLVLAIMLSTKCTPTRLGSRLKSALIAGGVTVLACLGAWLVTTPTMDPAFADEAARAVMSDETGLTDLSGFQVATLRSHAAILAVAVLGGLITFGLGIGQVFFRTVFYLPTLLAGVAMFLLWKTLYRPKGGLVNAVLQPVLDTLDATVGAVPPFMWYALGVVIWLITLALCVKLVLVGLDRLKHNEAGIAAFCARLGIVATLGATGWFVGYWSAQLPERALLPTGLAPITAAQLDSVSTDLQALASGDASLIAGAIEELKAIAPVPVEQTVESLVKPATVAGVELASLSQAVESNAGASFDGYTAGEGLQAPEWLISATWAKTALIVMGVWLGIGGGNMLLYLAGLSNIPPELYEAASIDGASGWQQFIHVTWPQLAPTTFFIVIMSTIGGLQGGFEQVMIMTQGKADTRVLAYYQYELAFTDQFQLGLASAVGWVMTGFIFVLTAVNFRLGSQLTND
ncbi:MAG: sugar ABC transporter permease [Planctomycetota bacterium]